MSENGGVLRPFHQASWNEPIVLEQSSPASGASCCRSPSPSVAAAGDGLAELPAALRRSEPPALPGALAAAGAAPLPAPLAGDARRSTSTSTWGRHVHDEVQPARSTRSSSARPRSPSCTRSRTTRPSRGCSRSMWRFERALCEISGMDRFTLPAGRRHRRASTRTRAMIRAYHAARGESHRDEIVTTIFSHPVRRRRRRPPPASRSSPLYPATSPAIPSVDAIKAAVSERTAGLMITNPEDTGIFNPHIAEIVDVVHDAGGLCAYDQANANGILGVTRARDAGFDLCQFNLHKTFSLAALLRWGCRCGASGVTEELAPLPAGAHRRARRRPLLPRPRSARLDRQGPGVPRRRRRPSSASYAWVLALGAEGLREVAEIAVLNNNYLAKKARRDPGHRRLVRRRQRHTAPRADPLQPGEAEGGHRRRDARRRSAHERLRRRAVLPEPRAVGGRGADDARAGGDRVARRPRHLRGDPRPDLGRGATPTRR